MKKNKKFTLQNKGITPIGSDLPEHIASSCACTGAHARTTSGLLRYLTLSALLGATASYGVQPNIDAGALIRQTEQEIRTQSAPSSFKAQPNKPTSQLKGDEASVLVSGFKFSGNSILADDVLSQSVAPYTNRSLTMNQLRQAVDAVVARYREAGWTVRAYLPKQEIEAGTIKVQVVEAVFGEVSVAGDQPKRVSASSLLNMTQANLDKGRPLHAAQLDRTLLLLDDLPGVAVAGSLVQGQRENETDLVLVATDESLVTGNAIVDNQGALATGSNRLSVNFSINSPLQMGDLVGVNALKTEGSDYQRVSYSRPLGYLGWRAGVHASNLSYNVITSEFAALSAHGKATTSGLDLSYPLIRAQTTNVNLALSYDDKKFDNSSNGSTKSYGINTYTAQLSANLIDNMAGGGVTNLSLGVTSGDKSDDGRYSKLNLSLSRLQSVTEQLSVYAAVGSQVANKNLDSSEKLYLGGASGVRAYPASEAGGSDGNTLTLELRDRVRHDLTLTGFYDYGHVQVNHDNNIASPALVNSYNLQGYGATLAWQASKAMEIKGTVAQRIGTNPAANVATGMDGDGTKKITRVWIGASIAF